MSLLTIAICSFNRASNLPRLIKALRMQACPIPFEILVIDNNSSDNTQAVLGELAGQEGPKLRYCLEIIQGITHARNRALQESMGSDFMLFIDDDELPGETLLGAAVDALDREGADCVGGAIDVDLDTRPGWLTEELLGFLGKLDHGGQPFWITDRSTPIWSGNIAYRMSLFRNDAKLRFDERYNRAGQGVGGGEDAAMFWGLLERDAKIRYRPDMRIIHLVEPWRLKKRYFLRLHYLAGLREGQYRLPDYPNKVFGIPPFLIAQFIKQSTRTVSKALQFQPNLLRQGMNAMHAWGAIMGYRKRGDGRSASPSEY
jgi:glycosyltransferase involved in cell wall biosynthesis